MVFLISRFQIIGTLSKLTQQIQPPHLMHHLPEQISAFDRQIGKIYVFLALLSMHGCGAAVHEGCPRPGLGHPRGSSHTRVSAVDSVERQEGPLPIPDPGEQGGTTAHRAGSCHAAHLEIWGCSAEVLVDVQGREKSCEHHAGHSGTCSHSHSLPHPQPPPPAPMGSHCFGSDEPHVRGSTSVAILQAQLCPSPAPALSSLKVQQGQSNKNFQCSPQLVPPQTLAMESCQSLGSPMGWAGFQPSLLVLGDSSTSQPQAEQGTWGSPNLGSNW